MKKIYLVWTFIIVLLLMLIIFIGLNLTRDSEYKALENEMEEVVSNYLGQYINEYPNNDEKKVNITDVINKGYEINMSVNGDVCDGYVVVKKVSIAYEYGGYIKCSNYTTKGFNK